MNKINLDELAPTERNSPKGTFRRIQKAVTPALRGENDRRPPFELDIVTIPPGARAFPFHGHTAQWEFYLVVTGAGEVRTPDGTYEIRTGDAFMCPPREAHQIRNTGTTDLTYHIIANNPDGDACYYPDSNKCTIPGGGVTRIEKTGYFDGEE